MSDLISKSALMKKLGIGNDCLDCQYVSGVYCQMSGGSACWAIFNAPTIEINLQELEDRFGKYVRFVVEDMMSGEGKRWENDKDRSNKDTVKP